MWFKQLSGDMINLSQATALQKRENTIVAVFGFGSLTDELVVVTEHNPKVLEALYKQLTEWLEAVDESRLREVSLRRVGKNGVR